MIDLITDKEMWPIFLMLIAAPLMLITQYRLRSSPKREEYVDKRFLHIYTRGMLPPKSVLTNKGKNIHRQMRAFEIPFYVGLFWLLVNVLLEIYAT